MKIRKFKYFMGDFETTVYTGQKYTEVWRSALVEFNSEDVMIHHSLPETFEYLKSLKENACVYYHNLKFDGSFWLSYLLVDLKMPQALSATNEWLSEKEMKNNTFKYSISDMGQWYTIIIKVNNKIIEIRDSLKLLPFSVDRIGKSFKTKHKKLEMEYTGFRYAGCEITEDEKRYIANDVLVVKERLEIMFSEGHNKLTIGSCCLAEYKKMQLEYNTLFPNLYDYGIDPELYGSKNIGEYIRKSYKGGWCYVAKGKQGKVFTNGCTADVNSLYPSVMHSESGNYYPVGVPVFWKGNYIPDDANDVGSYFFIRIKTRFYLKENHLPFIQIKNSLLYSLNECLESSDVYDSELNDYCTHYIDFDGTEKSTALIMTMTMVDYRLFLKHYDVVDFEILDGCVFNAKIGIFDDYINKYKYQKQHSTGARREQAKLFLNNLYGKMAANQNSSFKVAYIREDKSIGFYSVEEHNKKPGYIAVGSAITSYARNFTITARQKNYHGIDKPGFIYADTDSMHCDLKPDDIQGITIHDKNFCCWKIECEWDIGYFLRQKTYIEHNTIADGEVLDTPYYNIKCAGMPEKCKQLFIKSMSSEKDYTGLNEKESDFISKDRTIEDFTVGLVIPGKLRPERIKGGTLLVDTTYEMR